MKKPETIDFRMFAPCGMNCLVCYVHLKKKKPCYGCLGDDNNKPERCKTCEIKKCAIDKGFIYCYSCEMYPCIKIINLDKNYKKRYQVSLIENSKSVKNYGLEFFLSGDIERWICPECSGIISLHDQECSECGKKF